MNKLDSKANIKKVRCTTELAKEALRHYGEPSMSLAELRDVLDRKLGELSLSELIIKERDRFSLT